MLSVIYFSLAELKWSWSHSSLSFTTILITVSPLATMSSYHDHHQQKPFIFSSQSPPQAQLLSCTAGLFTSSVTTSQEIIQQGIAPPINQNISTSLFSFNTSWLHVHIGFSCNCRGLIFPLFCGLTNMSLLLHLMASWAVRVAAETSFAHMVIIRTNILVFFIYLWTYVWMDFLKLSEPHTINLVYMYCI